MAFGGVGNKLSGKRVIIHNVNVASVLILNLKTSWSKKVMYQLRRLVLQGFLPNIKFKTRYSSGIDKLSF